MTLPSSDLTPLNSSEEQKGEIVPENTTTDLARTNSIPVLSPAQGPPLGAGNGTGGGNMVDGVDNRLPPSSSRDAAGPGSTADVNQPQTLARQVPREPSVQDTHQEEGWNDERTPPTGPPRAEVARDLRRRRLLILRKRVGHFFGSVCDSFYYDLTLIMSRDRIFLPLFVLTGGYLPDNPIFIIFEVDFYCTILRELGGRHIPNSIPPNKEKLLVEW